MAEPRHTRRRQSNTKLITQMPQLQTAGNTVVQRLEHVTAELNAIREAVAPGVPGPATGTGTDRLSGGGSADQRPS